MLNKLGIHDPILDIAKQLEEVALQDPYFVEKKLYPNVDFYSGIIYRAIGFPTEMFTVLFALGRLPGWLAQWKEMRGRTTDRQATPDLYRRSQAGLYQYRHQVIISGITIQVADWRPFFCPICTGRPVSPAC